MTRGVVAVSLSLLSWIAVAGAADAVPSDAAARAARPGPATATTTAPAAGAASTGGASSATGGTGATGATSPSKVTPPPPPRATLAQAQALASRRGWRCWPAGDLEKRLARVKAVAVSDVGSDGVRLISFDQALDLAQQGRVWVIAGCGAARG